MSANPTPTPIPNLLRPPANIEERQRRIDQEAAAADLARVPKTRWRTCDGSAPSTTCANQSR
jgi:hypothetical protein